jgi:hypothetical protein
MLEREEVAVTTTNQIEPGGPYDDDLIPLDELARRQGVVPVTNLADMARPDLFDSDEDMEAFIAHVYACRRADLA